MTIIAHRGWWRGNHRQQNSPEAIAAALSRGWGVEFDVWASGAVGHDEPYLDWSEVRPALLAGSGPLLWDLKEMIRQTCGSFLAMAWKFTMPERSWLLDHELVDADMPSRLPQFRYLARASDRDEPLDRALAQPWAAGIWLDTFTTPWVTPAVLQRCRDAGKTPFIVSPELHGQPIDLAQWASWGDAAVCTDLPHLLAAMRAGAAALSPTEAWW